MNQRGYTIAFAVVLLATCLGAFFGGRYLYRQIIGGSLAGGTGGQTTWVPPEQRTDAVPTVPAVEASPGPLAAAATPTLRPAPTLHAVLTPFVPPTPTFEPTATPAPATPTSAVEQATSTPVSAFPFVLAGPVRATSGDCAGTLILGRVTDRAGNPLAGVHLHLTDEFGAVNTVKVTKSEQTDLGRYDFPLFGPPRRYYLAVEDVAGKALSAKVEIPHGTGSAPSASCHWVDWRQQ